VTARVPAAAQLPPPDTTERRARRLWQLALVLLLIGVGWLVRDFRWPLVWRSLPFLLRGLATSWLLALVSVALGLVAGIALAAARTRGPVLVRYPAIGFIELVRAIPQLMVIFWVFFTYPTISGGHNLSAWTASIVSLTAIAAAYLAEVVRAGLASVPTVQLESAFATGLTSFQRFRYVVLPQATRNMLPALIAHFVMMFKVTSLVYVTGLIDFFRAIILVNNRDYAPYAFYTTMGVGYFICCFALSSIVRRLDPKYTLTN
jgi:polar amino acid transport system permease protein